MFGFRSKKDRWQGVDYLTLIPVRRLRGRDNDPDGRVRVMMPRYSDPLLGRLLQPRLSEDKRYLAVTLDRRGSFLWRLLDGHLTVAELVKAFVGEFPGEDTDVPQRVSMYLHAMYDNKFIEYSNLPD